jgi:hypothetical protein
VFDQRFLLRFAVVVIVLGNFAVAPAGAQQAADASSQAPQQFQDSSSMLPQPARATPYSSNEVIDAGHHFFGGISRGLASIVEKAVSQWGLPNGYILGEEASGAFIGGLRYGEGRLYTKNAGDLRVFWQGPSLASMEPTALRTMLVYNLLRTEVITPLGVASSRA